jgi:formylglycine-generating enzyme required for sulfatase activity
MRDKNLMFGIIFCFVIAMVFILVIVWEIKKSIDHDVRIQQMAKKSKDVSVSDNRDFSIYETFVGDDGREMVLVPEGIFSRGSDSGGFDEKPAREIYLDAFYVDKYEVSVKEYNKYRKAASYVKPSVPFFPGDPKIMDVPSHAVVGVSWHDSVNYCSWAGKRLLSEAEWEKAARGTHGLDFPWGNKVLPKRANLAGTGDGYAYMGPVGIYPMGRSVYGIYDMAGNVSEWVSDYYDQFYYKTAPIMNPTGPEKGKTHVFKGGSWDARSVDIRTSKRFAANPGRKDSIVGFRCGLSKKDKK